MEVIRDGQTTGRIGWVLAADLPAPHRAPTVVSALGRYTLNREERTMLLVEFPALPVAVEDALAGEIRALVERTVAAQVGAQDAP